MATIKIDPTNSSGYFKIVAESGNTLMTVGSDGYYLQSDDYVENTGGMRINLKDGEIRAHKFTLEAANTGRIRLSTESPYFYINNGSHNLIYMGDDNYYLESSNWGNQSGFRLDLNDGSIMAYNNFTLTAMNGNQGMIISSTGATAISIFGTGTIQLNYDGSIVTNGCRIDPMGQFFGANDLFKIDFGGLGFALPGFMFDIADGAELFNGSGKGDYYKFGGKSATIGPWHINSKGIYSTGSFNSSPCVLEPDGEFKFTTDDMMVQFKRGTFWSGTTNFSSGLKVNEDGLSVMAAGASLDIGTIEDNFGGGNIVSSDGIFLHKGSMGLQITSSSVILNRKSGFCHLMLSGDGSASLLGEKGLVYLNESFAELICDGAFVKANAGGRLELNGEIFLNGVSIEDVINEKVTAAIDEIDFSQYIPSSGPGH